MLIVTDPDVIAQYSGLDNTLPKHPGVTRFLMPITGGLDLNCLTGETWRLWRKLFQPGFSTGHVLNSVPEIVGQVEVFRRQLFERAKKDDMFTFEQHALNVSIDIIKKIAL
jgi:cytochrome P450